MDFITEFKYESLYGGIVEAELIELDVDKLRYFCHKDEQPSSGQKPLIPGSLVQYAFNVVLEFDSQGIYDYKAYPTVSMQNVICFDGYPLDEFDESFHEEYTIPEVMEVFKTQHLNHDFVKPGTGSIDYDRF